jgi:hypothetical protein
VGTAGDVNGDGYDDILVGAPYYDNPEGDEGGIFVWYGSAGGLGENGTPENADWRAESNQASALFGYSVGTAGDVNGDGFDDIIVGAWLYDNPQSGEGMAFVWYGSAVGLGEKGTPANAGWKYESDRDGTGLGYAVATAGDVNGDGCSDIIVGRISTMKTAMIAARSSSGTAHTPPDWGCLKGMQIGRRAAAPPALVQLCGGHGRGCERRWLQRCDRSQSPTMANHSEGRCMCFMEGERYTGRLLEIRE